jgi:hypothetical protein
MLSSSIVFDLKNFNLSAGLNHTIIPGAPLRHGYDPKKRRRQEASNPKGIPGSFQKVSKKVIGSPEPHEKVASVSKIRMPKKFVHSGDFVVIIIK